jgi:CheY-like chemotaxis protein
VKGATLATLTKVQSHIHALGQCRKIIRKLGLKAESVSCGEDAVSRVAEGGVDIVLMDMQMPGMDGVQATEFIRGLALPQQPSIIALTANAYESDRHRCLAAGMDHFLPKPVRLQALREKLSTLVALPAHGA